VYVLDIDRKRERISLSSKRLQPDPWPTVTERLCKGQVVEGTITRIAAPGIFVDIGRGVEGLLRISEIPEDSEARNHLTAGSRVQVRILGLDRERRRIRLGVEQAARGRFLTGVASLWRKALGLIGRGHSTG
jgi:small subunit ribosomal protein S1